MYSSIEFKTKKEALKRVSLMKCNCKIIKTLNNKYLIKYDFKEI